MLCVVLAVVLYYYGYSAPLILRTGYNRFPPYLTAGSDGKPKGIAAEMLQRAAVRAGVQLRWVYIPRSADEAFRNGDIDLYPLLTVTDERKRKLNLSVPWWENELALTSPEAHRIVNAKGTAGKRIGIRLGAVESLAPRLFPKARIIAIPEIDELLNALCSGNLDGAFVDLRVLQRALLKGVPRCPNLQLDVTPVSQGNVSLATASSKASAREASKLYDQIANLALDGTLSEIASEWGVFSPYQSRHMKEVIDAQNRAQLLKWSLVGLLAVLGAMFLLSRRLRGARIAADRLREEAAGSQQRFDAFMSNTPAVTFVKDSKGRMVYINEAYCKQFETSLEAVKGRTTVEVWSSEFADQVDPHDREVLTGNQSREYIETIRDASGEMRTFLSLKFPFSNAAGEKFLGGVALDITDRKRAEEALRFSQFSIDRSPDLVFWMDAQGMIIYANRAACRKLGYDREEFQGMSIRDIDPTLTEERFVESRKELKRNGAMTLETLHRGRDGLEFPVEVSLNLLEFDGQEFTCSMSRDITERKRADRELYRHAHYDALTGLLNRRLFESRLYEWVERARAKGEPLSIFYMDLDGFKLVNDTLGHAVGDALLKQVARRLETCALEGDTLARMGGDEFTLIAVNSRTESDALAIGHRILSCLAEPFELAGRELVVTASVGISRFPQDGNDGRTLLQSADAAMYEGKHKGKNQLQFFTPRMGTVARERMEIEHHLQHAVERGEFELHYQPEVDLITGEVVRYEALARWNHPILGSLPPSKFIPIAEDTFSIVPIGTWLLEQACGDARHWRDREASPAGVAVNISTVQFARADFFDTVAGVLEKTGLDPRWLELELTESVVMNGLDEYAEKIAQLRKLGVRMAIDDFGTGYSSFRYLQKLRFDVMKIDRSFIQDLEAGTTELPLVQAMVTLAHSLNMKVVMEGIETAAQRTAVIRAGCDLGQGYLLGRPALEPFRWPSKPSTAPAAAEPAADRISA